MTDTNTAEREALMDLIDAYAEARHVGGCHTYNAKTAEARAKVVDSLAASAGSEPVAAITALWEAIGYQGAHTASTGNLAPTQKLIDAMNAVEALIHHPSPQEGMAGWKLVPVEPTPEMIEAGRDLFGDLVEDTESDYRRIWGRMVGAAPSLPASEKEL